ncbi:TIM barrel protein [Nakamurella sp. YIM 132087]|uniref:TIM barrel protein n=1 Tax=Nakamurella alba TaxID=2665158 RepID=A0A7K1FNM0_9ACTN|nr:sugar phosphate isomerase/epimerase [Nakamurella alba]MTD14823.1 TIM barrel protein [Nakamurella alba]
MTSVQLYSVRDAFAADGYSDVLARLAAIGFDQVEPFDFANRADELAPALEAAGLTAPSGHVGLLSGDQEAIFAAAGRLGIGLVVEPFVPAEQWTDLADVQRIADGLNAAAGRAAELGLRVGYHNHAWELSTRIDGVAALEVLAGLLDPAVLLEVDTYWASVGGEDPVALLGRLGDRVAAIHIKDGPAGGVTADQVPAGQGTLPIRDIVAAAPASAIQVVEFDAYAGDIFEGVASSLAFLRAGTPA